MPDERDVYQRDCHLGEGDLQAYLDAELEPTRARECAGHLRLCASCRRALTAVRARGDRVAGLLRVAAVRPVRQDDRDGVAGLGRSAS